MTVRELTSKASLCSSLKEIVEIPQHMTHAGFTVGCWFMINNGCLLISHFLFAPVVGSWVTL